MKEELGEEKANLPRTLAPRSRLWSMDCTRNMCIQVKSHLTGKLFGEALRKNRLLSFTHDAFTDKVNSLGSDKVNSRDDNVVYKIYARLLQSYEAGFYPESLFAQGLP